MQNDSSSATNQIREEIEAIKLRITEIEARLAEMEQPDYQEFQEDMPESLEPIDLSSDLSPELIDLNDIDAVGIEEQPIEMKEQPVEVEEQAVKTEEVEKEEVTAEEPLTQADTQSEEQGDFSIFGDEFGAEEPKRKKNINDVEKNRSKKAVMDVAREKYAWRTDMPGTPVKNILSAISLADRALFINTLFKGDPIVFNESINALNGMSGFEEAMEYISRVHPEWNLSSDVSYRLIMAIRRKLK